MNLSMMHPAEQIVTIMNRLYHYQMTTTSGGNLSIMDDEGVMWISPSGVDKGSLTPADIMRVLPDGTIVGPHKPSCEYPFHLASYRARPDFRAVLHAHPPALVAFSLFREIPDTAVIPRTMMDCPKVGMARYAVPGSTVLGENIKEEFEKGYDIVMMENHGAVIGAADLFSAFTMFETLDYAARMQLAARSVASGVRKLTESQLDAYRAFAASVSLDSFVPEIRTPEEQAVRKEICAMSARAYDNNLFSGASGTFSRRLKDGSFLITPHGKDRKLLAPEDIVLVRGGKAEAGKIPSLSVRLHEEIYKQNADIESVVIAESPSIMSFAITDTPFDARLIPESYISMKNVRKFPFEAPFADPAALAKQLTLKEPVAIIENNCVIACGTSLLNAFDRLEVMEYSARAVVDVLRIGQNIVAISPEEVHDIEVAFNL